MICRLCLNTLDEANAVLLFAAANDNDETNNDNNRTIPENYLVQLISTHLYLCLSRDDAISTAICSDCCVQLESFHNFWNLVELKQTTLCSQFLAIDCDVNWTEEGDLEQPLQLPVEFNEFKQEQPDDTYPNAEPDNDLDQELEACEDEGRTMAVHKFPCMFCEKSFKMRRYLEEHVATHTGDRPIACAYCNTAFRCRSNMYTHVKTKHTTQWQKARAERETAKINNNNNNNNNNTQIQRSVNGDSDKFMEAKQLEAVQQQLSPPPPPPPTAAVAASVSCTVPDPAPSMLSIKSEPMEAINLSVAKACLTPVKRVTRASRRKTHSPKKLQHTGRTTISDDSSQDELDMLPKNLKTEAELQTSKENELMLANYNAVKLFTAMAAVTTSSSTTISSNSSPLPLAIPVSIAGASVPESYTCSICGQQLRNQRALNNHLHNKHSTSNITSTAASTFTSSVSPLASASVAAMAMPNCSHCGEPTSSGGRSHRCLNLNKAKYACDVCGKSFKMKRYLEEHFATHTGVKLHTCAFCPTEFRSKSNMYHHTKRKHKLEWERSRASRNAAKAGSTAAGVAAIGGSANVDQQ